MPDQSQLSTQQSFYKDRTDPEIFQLLRSLSASLGNHVTNSAQMQEKMQQHNAQMYQQMQMMQQQMQKTQKMQEESNLQQMRNLQQMQQHINQTLARIDQREEPHSKSKQTHPLVAQEAYTPPRFLNVQTGNQENLFPLCNESSVQKKQSSEESDSSDNFRNIKIEDFIKKSIENLQNLQICTLTYDQFVKLTQKILDSVTNIVLEVQTHNLLRVFITRQFKTDCSEGQILTLAGIQEYQMINEYHHLRHSNSNIFYNLQALDLPAQRIQISVD